MLKIGKRTKVEGSGPESWQDGKPGCIEMEFRLFLPYPFSLS
jgi:hypothetical protein